MPEITAVLSPDDPRNETLRRRKEQSAQVQAMILERAASDTVIFPDAPALIPLGNDLTALPVAHGKRLRGAPTVGCLVFEDEAAVRNDQWKLTAYDLVVVASEWNRSVLADCGIVSTVCHEGVDPYYFNPAVKRERSDGRFRVFTGGKAEYRKGTDLVIDAFKAFAETHDDAVLVANWGSPFGALANDLENTAYGAPPGSHIGKPNFHAWLDRAGLKPHQYEIVEQRPNWRMAEVYGGCDIALYMPRLEGGTSFPVMEAISCSLPTIHPRTFGLSDIKAGIDASDTDEAVEFMGYLYDGVTWAEAQWQSDYWTWERHCREMKGLLECL